MLGQVNNLFLFHLYTPVEFGFISTVYFTIFKKWSYKKLILVISISFLSYLILSIFNSDLKRFDALNRTIESGILLVYFSIYLIEVLKNSKEPYLEIHPYFILTVGFVLYFAGTIIVFFISNNLDSNAFIPIWAIHSILNIFLNSIYSVVIWRSKKALSM